MRTTIKKKTEDILAKAGFRRTYPRQAILSVLLHTHRPITQRQIAKKLGSCKPNKVTIYRILGTFVDAGIVHKAFIRDRTWHFELANRCTETQCHPHFTCTICGDTCCMPDITIPIAQNPYKGFNITRQRTQLEGFCSKCNID